MRIFPLILIAVGIYGVLKHYGLIDPEFVHLFWPLLLIGIGVALLARGPRWHVYMHERMQDRWERRMNRRFGPGWANLTEEERERFRAGMRQSHTDDGRDGNSPKPKPTGDDSSSSTPGTWR